MTVINTNVKSLTAQASLSNINKLQATTMERLSTGLRINSAADDAAGLAITNRMTSQIRGYAVAIRNSNDGISMAQTAEGAMGQVNDMLQRMRELAVQASNGSMSGSDRTSIQDEVTQLKAQIQDIAVKTNHNNINLLDGSAGKIDLQTGVNAGDMMTMSFGSMQTKDIGLGSRASLSSTGGLRVASGDNDALSNGDLTLNGVVVGASLSTDDKLSSAQNASSAIAKAAAINAVAGQSGVFATVGKTDVTGTVMTTVTAGDHAVLKINGVSTADVLLTGNTEVDRASTVNAINAISKQTGVTAINTHDDKQGIALSAADGRNVDLDVASGTLGGTALTTPVTAGAALDEFGLNKTGTYVGSYELNTKDGSAINIGSTVSQAQTGEASSGLQYGSYKADVAQVTTINRAVNSSAALGGSTLVINGVGIGAANANDDTASVDGGATGVYANSVKSDSAIAIAAAINKATAKTGVTATAAPNVIAGTGFTALTGTKAISEIDINGVAISAHLGANSSRDDVLNLFNANKGATGVTAEAYGSGIKLTAADGRNISIGVVGTDGASSAAALGNTEVANALGLTSVTLGTGASALTGASPTATTFFSSVTLSSDKAFTVDSGSEGDAANLEALGFRQGTFGGADTGVKIAEVDVSTVAGATTAIKAIDAAIQTVSENQSKAGAYQNRLDHVVSNLTESNTNMSASRSRIQDADYGTETTNLAKAQIIQQAATAMLAQANQSSQSVLSLLK
jgi:flagellin